MRDRLAHWAHCVFLFGMGALALMAVVALFWAVWPSGWKGDGPAAWVQAIGSIAAIVGAFVVVSIQARHAEKGRAEERRVRKLAQHRQVALLTSDACEAIDAVVAFANPEDVLKHVFDADYKSRIPALLDLSTNRVAGLLQSVAAVLRSGSVELHELEPIWKLQTLLHEVSRIVAGIKDPARQIEGNDRVRLSEIAIEVKVLRFRTADPYLSNAPQ